MADARQSCPEACAEVTSGRSRARPQDGPPGDAEAVRLPSAPSGRGCAGVGEHRPQHEEGGDQDGGQQVQREEPARHVVEEPYRHGKITLRDDAIQVQQGAGAGPGAGGSTQHGAGAGPDGEEPIRHKGGASPNPREPIRLDGGARADDGENTRNGTAVSANDGDLPDLVETEANSPCQVCGTVSRRCCTDCQTAFYCSRSHQQRHWSAHRLDCLPYTVCYHPRLGRHLVATRSLRRGQLILRDRPLMVGPCQGTPPLCLGCYRPLAGDFRCRRCGWPLCSELCEQSDQHRPECGATARSPLGALSSQEGTGWYGCVSVLRLLELRHACPADWMRLLELQSHDVERRSTEAYRLEQRDVVERIRSRFGQFQHSELLIHRVCGIMETNAYEIRLPEINVQGVYPRAALFEHDCVPNTHRTFDEDLTLVVRAGVDIAEGDHLTSIYTDNLWGTWQRREHLATSKHFLCECARCSDPTELDTGFSSLRCPHCRHGYIQPMDPLQSAPDYRCSSCSVLVAGTPVRATLDVLQTEVEAVEEEPTISDCERLLRAFSRVLHPNHHLMVDLMYPLVHLYNTSDPLPLPKLNRKEELCRQLLDIADVLTPGISRLRGITLYELQQTLIQKARKLHKSKKKRSVSNAVILFKEARECLSEAVSVLRWEPHVQPEGQLGLEAVEELAELDAWLQEHAPAAVEHGAAEAGEETKDDRSDRRKMPLNDAEESADNEESSEKVKHETEKGCVEASGGDVAVVVAEAEACGAHGAVVCVVRPLKVPPPRDTPSCEAANSIAMLA